MKKITVFVALALASITNSTAVSAAERIIILSVDNMVCVVCAFNVKISLERVAGVTRVRVSLKEKIAVVVYDDAEADVSALIIATGRVGFPSAPKN